MRAYADEDSMGGAGAERADEAWVPMDSAEGQVCAEAVPMGCSGASIVDATKGCILRSRRRRRRELRGRKSS